MHRHFSPVFGITLIVGITAFCFGMFYMAKLQVDKEIASIPQPVLTKEYATISTGSSSAQVLIIEPTSSTTAEERLMPSELEPYQPSPESEWAKVYLQMLEIVPENLILKIDYVREWQQTGGIVRDLAQGSKGTDVKLVQYLLSVLAPSFNHPIPSKFITGTFGPQTKAAVIALQKKLMIKPDGIVNNETRFFLDSLYFKNLCPDANPNQDNSYENVSRRISVPQDYIPSDLIRLPSTVRTAGVMCLSREPARRLEEMFRKAAGSGIDLAVFSAYRSAKTQELLNEFYFRTMGKAGLAGVAEAGHSEHQLGTTVDLSGKTNRYAGPNDGFGKTVEGKWLEENSYKFGFIMSYPQGKDTGYIYEPWHFRYIGVDIAKDVHEENLTIQEYLDLVGAGR